MIGDVLHIPVSCTFTSSMSFIQVTVTRCVFVIDIRRISWAAFLLPPSSAAA